MRGFPPLIAAVLVLASIWAAVVWAWGALRSGSEGEVRKRLELVTEQAALRLEDYLNSRLLSVQVVQQGMESGFLKDREAFRTQSIAIQGMFGGFQALNWIDWDYRLTWVVPEETNQGAEGRVVLDHPIASQAILVAEESGHPAMSGPLDLFQGGKGFTAYYPVYGQGSDSTLLGFVNAVFRIGPLIEDVFDEGLRSRYLLELRDHDQEVYLSDPGAEEGTQPAEDDQGPLEGFADLDILDRSWALRLRPLPSTLLPLAEGDHRSFLIGGLTFGLASAFGAWLFLSERKSRLRRKEEEEEFAHREAQARKMEALGQLAGGVAHDFNNLLTVISGNASLASSDFEEGSRPRVHLDRIMRASLRASEMTGRLLAFSRSRRFERGTSDASHELHALEDLLKPLVREDIAFTLEIEADIGTVQLSPSELGQVVFNLVSNAADAMPEGGVLSMRAGRIERLIEGLAVPHLLIEVQDEGEGMTPETAERVFEPFFTTKESGRGTGLGLSTTYGIVRGAGGSIDIRSRPGHGTLVEVQLPIAEEPEGRKAKPSVGREAPTERLRFLVVEDEDPVRQVAVNLLEQAGHVVVAVANGLEALEAYRTDGPFDVVFSDTVMPRLGGLELARRLRSDGFTGRLILCSGYTTELSPEELTEMRATFLAKPYASDELLAALESSPNPSLEDSPRS